MQTAMEETDVLVKLLETLVGGALDEEGEAMLLELYDISTANFNEWTPQHWAAIGERAIQAKWFLDHLKEIKEKFQLLIDAQISFREFQGWLMVEGYKGAEKIKEAQIDVAVARAKLGATVEQQDYRLTKQQEQFEGETAQFKLLWDNKVIAGIAKKVAEVDAAIAKMQGNPEFAEQLRQWKDAEDKTYKEAELGLKYGFHGLSHPSLNPPSSPQLQSSEPLFVPVSRSSTAGLGATKQANLASTATAKDSINLAVNWSGDVASQVKGVASRINRGFTRFGNFFGGKA
ncbi:hypothetical protein QUB00_20500 [Microcoleus sp. F8_C2]